MQKVDEWTGERFLPHIDPTICGAEIHYEHLHRYAFAAEFARGKRVLDLASGEGYGSHMLSRVARRVTGVELDRDTVEHAAQKYKGDNIRFVRGSILDVPLEGGELFDVIVCFEAIEHVGDHDRLLAEVKRLLTRDGLFIVSTPNKIVYNDGAPGHNPFHVKELELDGFRELLEGHFRHTVLFGQKVVAGSSIWPLSTDRRLNGYYEYLVRKDEGGFLIQKEGGKCPKYYIAISSDASLEYVGRIESALFDVSNVMIKELLDQFNLMQKTLLAVTGSLEWRLITKAHGLVRRILRPRARK